MASSSVWIKRLVRDVEEGSTGGRRAALSDGYTLYGRLCDPLKSKHGTTVYVVDRGSKPGVEIKLVQTGA
jgi:hypothetical protein